MSIEPPRHDPALLLIILLMTAAIAMIGLAPTYAAIGVAAPLVIVVARLLQGFSAGGEFASAPAFLIESAPSQRRAAFMAPGKWSARAWRFSPTRCWAHSSPAR